MKDIIKTSNKAIKIGQKEKLAATSLHIIVGALGFLASRGVVFDNLMPFGLVFAAGCTQVFLPSVATGVFLGYFFPAASSGGFRYIAALLGVIAVRLLLSGYKKVCENTFFLSTIALISNLATAAATYSGIPIDIVKMLGESLIIFGAVFITNNTFTSIEKNRYGLSTDEIICLIVTLTLIIIGISNFTIYGISAGQTIGVFLILIAAKYGGITLSCVCGIMISFAAAVTGAYEGGIGVYALSGLMAGIFSSLGKYAQATSVIATGIIGVSFFQFKDDSTVFLIEIIIGSIIFLLIPRSLSIYLSKIFYSRPKTSSCDGLSKAVRLRLDLASSALTDVAETVCQVSAELGKINAPDFQTVLSYIEQDACSGCKLRLHCWENKNASTINAVMKMINIVKGSDTAQSETELEEFRGRCLRIKKMEDTIKNRYSQYTSIISAENRIDEVRQVVSEQFEGMSDMLGELSKELSKGEQFNRHAATTAARALKNIGINTKESTAKIDGFGRMSLEINIDVDQDTVLNRLQIMKMLSVACERDFDIPNITKIGNSALITVNEHAALRVDIGVQQQCAAAGSICGDAYKFFNDGKGHFIMVLSDGMGTGGRAAVDGAMASGLMARLLKAGFGYDCSLKILNSSMLFKSSDESLATMDIASIDLFTGNTELYKAGAAPTLVRRGGNAGRAESTSLPIGILKDVSFDRAGIRLRYGDILLLVSDGVTFDGTEWIRRELEAWGDGGAQELAEHICACARRRRTEERHDDITVMAAIIEKAV